MSAMTHFPFQSSQSPNNKMMCIRTVFKETMNELTEFSELQLESFQNITPETKKKLKTAIMGSYLCFLTSSRVLSDVLSSLGLVLEVSTAPTVSLSMLPIFREFRMSVTHSFPIPVLRAKNHISLLERDIENLMPESESLSNSMEPLKNGVMAVLQGMPIKAVKCFQGSEL